MDEKRDPIVVCSAPLDYSLFCNCVEPVGRISGTQSLLGYEAQIRALAEALNLVSIDTLISAAPEIFYAPQSLRQLDDAASQYGRRLSDVVHLRLGPPRKSKVLRGTPNIFINTEQSSEVGSFVSRNPFASNTVLPAAFRKGISWGGGRMPTTIDNQTVETIVADESITAADLYSGSDFSSLISSQYARHPESLLASSVEEFNQDAWRLAILRKQVRTSRDFSRLLVAWDRKLNNQLAPRPGILVPWNLADPASNVPDIVTTLVTFQIMKHFNHAIFIYPFNANNSSLANIDSLVNRLRHQARGITEVLQKFFIVRAPGASGVEFIQQITQIALLQEADPEWKWSLQRFDALGIGSALIAPSGQDFNGTVCMTVAATEPIQRRTHDEFGERFFNTACPEPLALAEFLHVACGQKRWTPRKPPSASSIYDSATALKSFIST